ncbi:MAG: T9SS type A sorting domain-containing protein [Candidatus Kapaibacterium sp.]|nr:T9SS type A sorting domain-containing protein [Ignavibacteria bacterium]
MGIKTKIIMLILSVTVAFAQPETETWYFGIGAGIDFTSGKPEMISGPLKTNEGCSIFCDRFGKPMFFTDGQTIWNRENKIMQNGTGLMGHPSSTQSAVVVEIPSNKNLYYVVTALNVGRKQGLNYSLIDMRLDNGRGAVVKKNINLHNRIHEKITVCATPDYKTYWLIATEYASNNYLAYRIDSSGIDSIPIVSKVGGFKDSLIVNNIGYIKASPNSKYVINAHQNKHILELSSFDYKTGKINLIDEIELGEGSLTYGLEFSPDSRIIYVGSIFPESKVYQILHPALIDVNEIEFYELGGWSTEYILGALQLGPDKKLYVTNDADSTLGVVNFPWLIGQNADYQKKALQTLPGTYTTRGLPNFLTNYFYDPMLCDEYLYDERNEDTSKINLVQEFPPDGIDIGYDVRWMKGALWSEEMIPISGGFTAEFQVQLSKGGKDVETTNRGGTGFAFVLQTKSGYELGSGQDGLAYEGLENSLVIEFDQNKDIHENDGNHLAVMSSRGKISPDFSLNGIKATNNIPEIEPDNNLYKCLVFYHNKQLKVYISPESYYLLPQLVIDNFDIENFIDLEKGRAYMGITTATTNVFQQTTLKYFRYCSQPINESETSSVSINNITDYSMQINPNPATDIINIDLESDKDVLGYKIYNLKGEIVQLETVNYTRLQNLKLDVGSLVNGVYIVKLELGTGIKTGKFIINK